MGLNRVTVSAIHFDFSTVKVEVVAPLHNLQASFPNNVIVTLKTTFAINETVGLLKEFIFQ